MPRWARRGQLFLHWEAPQRHPALQLLVRTEKYFWVLFGRHSWKLLENDVLWHFTSIETHTDRFWRGKIFPKNFGFLTFLQGSTLWFFQKIKKKIRKKFPHKNRSKLPSIDVKWHKTSFPTNFWLCRPKSTQKYFSVLTNTVAAHKPRPARRIRARDVTFQSSRSKPFRGRMSDRIPPLFVLFQPRDSESQVRLCPDNQQSARA